MYNNWRWEDTSELDYTNWGEGQPDSHDTSQYCGKVRQDGGKWDDVLCSEKKGFICKAKKSEYILLLIDFFSTEFINFELQILNLFTNSYEKL